MTEALIEGYVVKIGENFYRIKSKEPFNYVTGDYTTAEFGAVATATESGFVNIEALEPDRLRLYQVWVGVKDGERYWLKIPTGTNRYGVDEKQDVGYIDNEKSPYYAKNKHYEFWLIRNVFPSVNAVNDTGITLTPVVWFEGMKYELEKVTITPQVYKIITIGGLATTVIGQ